MKKGLTRKWADFTDVLDRDPASRKWMVNCAGCLRVGLRADTPDRFWNRLYLEKLGRVRLDVLGQCEQCRYAVASASAAAATTDRGGPLLP